MSCGATPDIANVISPGKPRPAPRPTSTIVGQHVDDVAAVDRRAGEQQHAGADEAGRPRAPCRAPKRIASGPESTQRHRAHHDRRGQEREPDLRARRSRGSAAGTARRGRTCRTCRPRAAPARRWRRRRCASGTGAAASAGSRCAPGGPRRPPAATSESAPSPSVRPEPQPCSLTCRIV